MFTDQIICIPYLQNLLAVNPVLVRMESEHQIKINLIEETMGAFPTWLAPVQVKIIPIADRHQPYANEVCKKLEECGLGS